MSLKFTTLNMQCQNKKQRFSDIYSKSRSIRYSDYIKRSKSKNQQKDNFNSFILKLKAKSGNHNRKTQQPQQFIQQQCSSPIKISLYQQYKRKQSIKRNKYTSNQNNTLDLSNIAIKGQNLKQIYPLEWKNKQENGFNISEILHSRKKQIKEISVKNKQQKARKGLTTSDGTRIRKYFKVDDNNINISNINNMNLMNNNNNNMNITNNIMNNNNNIKVEVPLYSIGIMGIKTSFLDKYKLKDQDQFLFFNDNIEGSSKRRQILCSVKKNSREAIQIQSRHTKTSLSSVKYIRSNKKQDNFYQKQDKLPCRPWSPNKDQEFQKLS